jgi:hypothetical protein
MTDNADTQIPDYDEVLRMLVRKAEEGSVSAMMTLERALRPVGGYPEPDDYSELERILDAKK